jgi:hypothetical protein
MSYRNGVLYFMAKEKDIGKYIELVTIKGPAMTKVVDLRIQILPPIKAMQCPYGNKPGDCLP